MDEEDWYEGSPVRWFLGWSMVWLAMAFSVGVILAVVLRSFDLLVR